MTESSVIQQITSRDRERIRGYQDLLDFYQGKQWPGRERWGEKRLTFNYARVFIDKLTSYLMSGINFMVEAVRDTPEARANAESAEKALAQIYEDNHLEQLDFETETDCAILGDGCYKVTWEGGEGELSANSLALSASGKAGRVRVTAPDISGIYAWYLGDDLARTWRVASRYTLTAEEVELLYGKGQAESSQLKTIIEVWTEKDFELYLDNQRLEQKPNPYGFIPFVIFPDPMRQNL